jgi:hypothetical protein
MKCNNYPDKAVKAEWDMFFCRFLRNKAGYEQYLEIRQKLTVFVAEYI